MTIDGFSSDDRDAFVAFDDRTASRASRVVHRLGRKLGVEVEGLERIPSGRALIVANHTFGFDVAFAIAAVRETLGRQVFSLGEHAWWKVPFLRRLAASCGTVDGTRANADRLLDSENLVLVLPGGLRESMKPRELRYRLLWGHRYGFIRAAIRNSAPIIPLAAIGGDDLFDLVGNPFRRGARILGRFAFPIPRPAHYLPIPHLTRLRFVFGDPIVPKLPPSSDDDPNELKKLRHEVAGELHELIERELAKRCGFESD